MTANFSALFYLISAVCFIMALRGLSSASTAKTGNFYGVVGMVIAVLTTLLHPGISRYGAIFMGVLIGGGIGAFVAYRIRMTALPQLVAGFHSLVGLAAVCVAAAAFHTPEAYGVGTRGYIHLSSLIEMSLGSIIGAITFSGSVVAFAKLQGLLSGKPLQFPYQHMLNLTLGVVLFLLTALLVSTGSTFLFWLLTLVAFGLGLLLILPIGGADMPVIVSMLNSYSGWAAAGIGFTLSNSLLIITGALVGSSGAILSYIMCKGMNRSIFNVILGGFGTDSQGVAPTAHTSDKPVKTSGPEDAAVMLENARSVIIVPGYGMAVAQAQHSLKALSEGLKKQGVRVRYAIHPVAGRMPGHMNVLLAEANVPYDDVQELEEINTDFAQTDVVLVIGANDITNPAAKTDPQSPIYGMPVLDVDQAKVVLFIKRSLASGYAGIDNPLFYKDNTFMVLGDAKVVCDNIIKGLHHD